jgi:hypothetical protein
VTFAIQSLRSLNDEHGSIAAKRRGIIGISG